MSQNGNQPQMTFPSIQVVVSPQGIIIVTHYAPHISSSVMLDEATCVNMFKQWHNARTEQQRALKNIQLVKGSRND